MKKLFSFLTLIGALAIVPTGFANAAEVTGETSAQQELTVTIAPEVSVTNGTEEQVVTANGKIINNSIIMDTELKGSFIVEANCNYGFVDVTGTAVVGADQTTDAILHSEDKPESAIIVFTLDDTESDTPIYTQKAAVDALLANPEDIDGSANAIAFGLNYSVEALEEGTEEAAWQVKEGSNGLRVSVVAGKTAIKYNLDPESYPSFSNLDAAGNYKATIIATYTDV